VAVHEPCSRVIGQKGDHEPTPGIEHGNVPASGIGPLEECSGIIFVERAQSSSQNIEIMPVKVDPRVIHQK
jgi:hypothetical protein